MADDRLPGYVKGGIFKAGETGEGPNAAKIVDESTALGFQSIPTYNGKNINNISIIKKDDVEYLCVNESRYINAKAAKKFSTLFIDSATGASVVIGTETLWFDIDGNSGGRSISIETPQGLAGAWFLYDNKMNCIATSLAKNPRNTIILPENGRIAFAGEGGVEFILR